MADFEVCSIGTKRRIAELEHKVSSARLACEFGFICHEKGMNLERALREYDALNDAPPNLVREFTDEEKSDMYWQSNTAEGIAPEEDLPVFLKPQAD